MTRFSSVASLLLTVVVGPGFQARALADDPLYNPSIFRGGSARLGDLGGITIPASAEVLWRFDFDVEISGPVVADGMVYVVGRQGWLFAIKADGSDLAWKIKKPGRSFYLPPAVVGDRLYLATDRGLMALARSDGETLWEYEIKGGAPESIPLVVGKRIMVAGYDGLIHAVNLDGSVAWTHDIVSDAPDDPPGFNKKNAVMAGNAARPSTMACDGATVFSTIFDQSRVVAVDASTGKRRWSFQSKGFMYAEPTVAGDDVFVTSQDKSLYSLDKATGKVRWSFPTKDRVESGVAVRDGSVYFGSCDGFFYRVDVKTGKAVWSFETSKGDDGKHHAIYSSPIVSADAVCFGSFDGYLYALGTADGALKWKVKPVEGAEVSSSPCFDGRSIIASVRASFRARPNGRAGANSLVAVGEPKP